MKTHKFNLDPAKATFIENPNGKYTVLYEVPGKGLLKLYNVSVNIESEVALTEENADFCEFFPYRKKRPIRDFLMRIKHVFYNT